MMNGNERCGILNGELEIEDNYIINIIHPAFRSILIEYRTTYEYYNDYLDNATHFDKILLHYKFI